MTTTWIIAIMLVAYALTLLDHIRLSRRIDRMENALGRTKRDLRIGLRDHD